MQHKMIEGIKKYSILVGKNLLYNPIKELE